MIRFEVDVRIAYLSCPLVELLAAASLWSALAARDLVFLRIHDPTIPRGTLHGFALSADVVPEGIRADDLAALHVWLQRVLTPPWLVDLAPDHVSAAWELPNGSVRRPSVAAMTAR